MSTMTRPRSGINRRSVRPAHGIARLTLTINGTPYSVRPLPCDASAASRVFRLRKADGTAYAVAMTEYGATCDCPDWTFHRDGIDPDGCKHVRALTAVGLMPEGGAR